MKPWSNVELNTKNFKEYVDPSTFKLNSFETRIKLEGKQWVVVGSRTKHNTKYFREHLLQNVDNEYDVMVVEVNTYKPKENYE